MYRLGFFKRHDYNFISVDWALLASLPNYPKAIANIPTVGNLIGNFVNFLIARGADLGQFHFIGFSLGAHIVSFASRAVRGGIVPRITGKTITRTEFSRIEVANLTRLGLDPAFPLFEKALSIERLSKMDAQFVDVIHTNAGKLENGRLGFPFSVGHADFWPNGGSSQPVMKNIISIVNISNSKLPLGLRGKRH